MSEVASECCAGMLLWCLCGVPAVDSSDVMVLVWCTSCSDVMVLVLCTSCSDVMVLVWCTEKSHTCDVRLVWIGLDRRISLDSHLLLI